MRSILLVGEDKRVLLEKWWMLLAVPAVNAALIIIFWQSQLLHYQHHTTGILFMWLVAGLLFVLVQLSLQWEALRRAKAEVESEKLFEVRWSLAVQVGLFILIAAYNTIALIQLLLLGALPSQPFDALIGMLLLATIVTIAIKYQSIKTPAARLLLATGTKAAPQVLQAGAFVVLGSAGMHWVTVFAITAMGILRYLLTRHAVQQYQSAATNAANAAAFRDLLSIFLMGLGWVLGRL